MTNLLSSASPKTPVSLPCRTMNATPHLPRRTAPGASLLAALLLALSGLFATAPDLSAQLPQASARALGMGYNMTASARGFAAVANNPAGLAHWESPGFSLAIPAATAGTGLGPVTLADIAEYEGAFIPDAQKAAWLQSVTDAGGQAGILQGGLTPLALNIGPVGFQLSSAVGGRMQLSPDAAELLLYGNAGRTGVTRDFALDGSSLDAFVLSTAALSLGVRASDRVYLGVTGKYVMGNGLVMGRDAGSVVRSDPLQVELQFPVIANATEGEETEFNNGTGFGFDLGAIVELPMITLGASVENVVNTFAWELDGLAYIPGAALFDTGSSESDFDEQPAENAPQDILDMVDELTLRPVYSVGAEIDLPLVRLQADIRKRTAGGLQFGPEFHAGVGAELKLIGFLPLRAHAAKITGGYQAGGGLSLILGPVNLSAGGAYQSGELEDAAVGMFTLSFGGN